MCDEVVCHTSRRRTSRGAEYQLIEPTDMYLDLKKYELQLGEFGPEDEEFCPWRAVKEYPWKFSKLSFQYYAKERALQSAELVL